MHDMTAAHRSLPFGTVVRVQRRDTGAEVEVRVNDRGPFIKGRIIDLSFAAAKVIGLDRDGVAPVKLKVLDSSRPKAPPEKQPVLVAEDAPESCFWLQVGAFASSENAQGAVRRLKNQGEKALAMEGPDGMERVRVGPFPSRNEAVDARERLMDRWPSSRIVRCGG
jgi:rare lipoprotein A